jgi:hypothetical protein
MNAIQLLNEYMEVCDRAGYYPNREVAGKDVVFLVSKSEWRDWKSAPTSVRHYAFEVVDWISNGEPMQMRMF